MKSSDESGFGAAREFPSTSWSAIFKARDKTSPDCRAHLELLFSRYWKPVFHYAHAVQGRTVEDARDLTQEFFAKMLERDFLKRLDPKLGSFRGFLRRSIRNFVVDAVRHEKVRRPPASRFIFPLDDLRDEEVSPDMAATPEERFDQAWNRSVFDECVQELKERMHGVGSEEDFRLIREYYLQQGPSAPEGVTHIELAKKFGVAESTVRKRLSKGVNLLLEILRNRVREYVPGEEDVEPELRRVLGR